MTNKGALTAQYTGQCTLPKSVFITGGSGFVGQHFIRALTTLGVQVSALGRSDRACTTLNNCGATPVFGGLGDESAIAAGVAGAHAVIHCAARKNGQRWHDFHRDNVEATQTLLGLCADAGVKQFVNLSTGSLIAALDPPPMGVDEGTTLPAIDWSPYLATKALAEKLVSQANNTSSSRSNNEPSNKQNDGQNGGTGMATASLRPCLIWGENAPFHQNVANMSRGPMGFIGCQRGAYPYATIHVSNLVESLVALLGADAFQDAMGALAGGAWFVNDPYDLTQPHGSYGPEFRGFIDQLQQRLGVRRRFTNLPYRLVRALAGVGDGLYSVVRVGHSMNLQTGARLFGQPLAPSDSAFRRLAGYHGSTSIADGFETVR